MTTAHVSSPPRRPAAAAARPDRAFSAVIAIREYEAWLVAGADSLADRRGLRPDLVAPPDPESVRDAKGWLRKQRIDGLSYSPTADQAALSAVVDLHLVRSRSPSFDELWREVERLAGRGPL